MNQFHHKNLPGTHIATVALGTITRHRVSRYPGEDEIRIRVRSKKEAETARKTLNGRTLRVSKYGTGYFPLHIYVGKRFYAIAGTEATHIK